MEKQTTPYVYTLGFHLKTLTLQIRAKNILEGIEAKLKMINNHEGSIRIVSHLILQ